MSNKSLEKCNRHRNVMVGFRMSEFEAQELNDKVALSGLGKRQYIANCLLNHEIRVVCGMKVARTMEMYLEGILEELQFMEEGENLKEETIRRLQNILDILEKAEA